jgi:hypothetical protein
MTDVRPEPIAARQDGVVARWQLRHAGMSPKAIETWTGGLRSLHDGVYVTGCGSVTQRQRWWAAVLTAPGTVLSHASAGALLLLRRNPGVETVTRVGTRGRLTEPGLRVSYSLVLRDQIVSCGGLPVTRVERTIIDLWPHLPARERPRLLREALRLRRTTTAQMLRALRAHRGRRGVAGLRAEVERLAPLALDRCRSDAEALAVALLHDAGVDPPEINRNINGHEADLSWPAHRLIVEVDGPSFHVLRDADLEKTRRWERAGYSVRRILSNDLCAEPAALLRLAPPRTSVLPPHRG